MKHLRFDAMTCLAPLEFPLSWHISQVYFTNQDFTGYDGIVVIQRQ
jgi:hypothetical protein